MERMARTLRGRLIDEVQRRPALYHSEHASHRDADVRDQAWLEISERLGVNSELLKREWKILRDSYRQALKKAPGRGGRRWAFEARMAFLLPFMAKRPVYTTVPAAAVKPELRAESPASPASPAAREPREPRGPRAEGGGGGGAAGDAGDALELFFASVCASARRLARPAQAQLKAAVLAALQRAEARQPPPGDRGDPG